ncbi:MAG: hypothetical protein WDM79_15495 [Terricaulis sp.]
MSSARAATISLLARPVDEGAQTGVAADGYDATTPDSVPAQEGGRSTDADGETGGAVTTPP